MKRLCVTAMMLSILLLGCGAETDVAYSLIESPAWTATLVQDTTGSAPDDATANSIFNNRVVIAIIAAAVGILLTGTVNIILQYIGDKRRFNNEREVQREQWDQEAKVQKEQWDQEAKAQREQWDQEAKVQEERWDQEAKVQKERWEREDTLRNYDERRLAYIETLRVTDALGLVNLRRSNRTDDAMKLVSEAARVKAELRALAPVDVVFAGEQLITAYNDCVMEYAEHERIPQEKAEQLNQRIQQFAVLGQIDLALIDKTDPRAKDVYQKLYKEAQDRRT